MTQVIDFQTDPTKYRHWRVEYDGEVANLFMDVDEAGGLFPGYELKLNSYDLGVDIELADVVQRMRFEHPEVKVVVMQSAKDKVFCAGANIRMLGGASHAHKVNFCKFTNETRNTFEAAEVDSGQMYMAAIKGACAGGGYELALACNYIMLTNDSASSVSLPEVPLLAVLPGTGGLTRVTDKRKVRRDLADVFCSIEEGVKGQRAVDWKLVDEVVANSKFDAAVLDRAAELAAASAKPSGLSGIELTPLERRFGDDGSVSYSTVEVVIDRKNGRANITLKGPDEAAPADMAALQAQGAESYILRLAREFDDALLHLRLNEREVGLMVFRTQGDSEILLAHEELLLANKDHWLANEILKYWKRVLKRVDMTSRSLVALVEHGSCFAGMLAELLWSVDRSYMMLEEFEGDNRSLAAVSLSEGNFGSYPMGNDLTRLQTRFLGDPDDVEALKERMGEALVAEECENLGLITYAFDDIDWEDEVRLFMEERASFSPDAMTGMEANLRFAGPETMETRIFGRLTAWQNWIFQRPNAVGPEGALQRYGTGKRGEYNMERV
ncbi:2,3-epoxybenzoyl-CoA dihydrolase [Parasedimentitalea psychrophila]|uniref:2,3-epoxybenzoyl-CoA dihydrolase n=1 Tax=Parasedimentitalea psychrophila TaxID=2997337 RepID=A0A9Y2P8I7_9RHOB|nr:2,3-epoxybenzoyl-CoA dihydrolase [Parasedimentitalea psychrophila]WIY26940.1 2,3-epoxybenzoyl-CoA dihydrolase [Parasedimentitalea psychrophila]